MGPIISGSARILLLPPAREFLLPSTSSLRQPFDLESCLAHLGIVKGLWAGGGGGAAMSPALHSTLPRVSRIRFRSSMWLVITCR